MTGADGRDGSGEAGTDEGETGDHADAEAGAETSRGTGGDGAERERED